METTSAQSAKTSSPDLPPFPDLRQSLCHTLLAAAFILLGGVNFGGEASAETKLHLAMMVLLVLFAIVSWSFAIRKRSAWGRLPENIRRLQIRVVRLDKNRAQSHALMSALSLLLTGFVFLERAFMPEMSKVPQNRILFGTAVLIAASSAAVFARVVRDLLIQRKQ